MHGGIYIYLIIWTAKSSQFVFIKTDDNNSSKSDDASSTADGFPGELDDASSDADDYQSESDQDQNDSSSVICDFDRDDILNRVETLVQKKLQSHADDEFETNLVEVGHRSYLRASDLDVLIQSRGVDLNASDNRKKKLKAWMALKDAPMAWQRTATWSWVDEEDLLELQASLG
jgi:hypothetical protein